MQRGDLKLFYTAEILAIISAKVYFFIHIRKCLSKGRWTFVKVDLSKCGCPHLMETFTNSRRSMFISNIATQQIIHTTEHRAYYYARVSVQDRIWLVRLRLSKNGSWGREIITDKASGKDIDRPGYQALKTTLLRPGDTLVIVSLDRLSRKKGRH